MLCVDNWTEVDYCEVLVEFKGDLHNIILVMQCYELLHVMSVSVFVV